MPAEDTAPPSLALEILVSHLPQEGLAIEFAASAAERQALAPFFDLLQIDFLSASLQASRGRGAIIAVDGRLRAKVVHASVLTLDPVVQIVDEPVALRFVESVPRPARRRDEPEAELVLSLDDDPPDVFTGGRIPLGDSLREVLALALDPYPRGGEAGFEGVDTDPDPEGGTVSPFAALARLKSGPDAAG